MKARWYLQLVHDFDVKPVALLWRISLGAVGLFDGDDGYLLTQDFERNLLYEADARVLGHRPMISQLKSTRILVGVWYERIFSYRSRSVVIPFVWVEPVVAGRQGS